MKRREGKVVIFFFVGDEGGWDGGSGVVMFMEGMVLEVIKPSLEGSKMSYRCIIQSGY